MVPRAMARQRPWESLRKMAKTKAGTCPQVNVPTVVSHSLHRSEPLPMQPEPNTFRSLLGRSGLYALELPALRPVSEPWRRHLFRRPYGAENDYYGVYPTFAAARDAANSLSTRELPASYDIEAAGRLYRDHMQRIRVSDYPLVFWLGRLIADGQRSVFDLGGHIGVSYYGFRKYIDYPADLSWTIHDLPSVMAAGRRWAQGHDAERQLSFIDSVEHADGQDILLSTGRSEEHTSELQSLMRISYAVFCLKKKQNLIQIT